MAHATRHPMHFSGAGLPLVLLGLGPKRSWVEVDPAVVRVVMGWAFRSTVARSSVRSATLSAQRPFGWGVHGWRGEWLVNGSRDGVVRIEIDPPARATVCGVPVRLARLLVSVASPEELIRALEC